jgi:hypothetical protein
MSTANGQAVEWRIHWHLSELVAIIVERMLNLKVPTLPTSRKVAIPPASRDIIATKEGMSLHYFHLLYRY